MESEKIFNFKHDLLLQSIPLIRSVQSFHDWVSQSLFSIYRFESAFFGRGSTHSLGATIDCEICINLPDAYRATLKTPSGGIQSAPLQNWFRTRQPQAYNVTTGDVAVSPIWAENFEKFGFKNLMIHGHIDSGDGAMAVFGLYNYAETIGVNCPMEVASLAHVIYLAMRKLPSTASTLSHSSSLGEAMLTVREREVLDWVRWGKTNSEIGSILEISLHTVRNHIANIMRKLSVVNRTQAAIDSMGVPRKFPAMVS